MNSNHEITNKFIELIRFQTMKVPTYQKLSNNQVKQRNIDQQKQKHSESQKNNNNFFWNNNNNKLI